MVCNPCAVTKNIRNRRISKWGQQRNKQESYCAFLTASKREFLSEKEQHIKTTSQTVNKKRK